MDYGGLQGEGGNGRATGRQDDPGRGGSVNNPVNRFPDERGVAQGSSDPDERVDTRRSFEKRLLLPMNHHRMNAEPAQQLSHGQVALERLKRNLRPIFWIVLLTFRHTCPSFS